MAVNMSKEIKDLNPYKKNPRKITEKMFNLLSSTLEEYGDLSGIILNIRTNEVVGGNQRTSFFKQHPDEVNIVIQEKYKKPTKQGTTAVGYIEYKGERFNYREVDWDASKSDRANVIANKVGGFWDNDILANEFDIEDLKFAGFDDFELAIFNEDNTVVENDPYKEWEGMPDYSNQSRGVKVLVVHFETHQHVRDFENLIGQKIGDKTKYIWFPEREKDNLSDFAVEQEDNF